MATPHVSGTGALLMSRGLTNLEAWTQISGTATDLGPTGFDLFYGWGRVDALAATTQTPYFPPISDTTPPNVAFVSPQDGYVVDQNAVTVKVEASDDQALGTIELRLWQLVGSWWISQVVASSSSSSLTYKWQTRWYKSGTYRFEARAMDAFGHSASTEITVTKP
jgi:hypothetical protein